MTGKKEHLVPDAPSTSSPTTASTSGTWRASPARPARAVTSDSRELDELFGTASSGNSTYRSQRAGLSAASSLARHVQHDEQSAGRNGSVRTARSVSNLTAPSHYASSRSSIVSSASNGSSRERRASMPVARSNSSTSGDNEPGEGTRVRAKHLGIKRQRLSRSSSREADASPSSTPIQQQHSATTTSTTAAVGEVDRDDAKTPRPQPSRGWLSGWYGRGEGDPTAPRKSQDDDKFESAPSSPAKAEHAGAQEPDPPTTPRAHEGFETQGRKSSWWGWRGADDQAGSGPRDEPQAEPRSSSESDTESREHAPSESLQVEPQTITKSQSRSWLSSIWGEAPSSSTDVQAASSVDSNASAKSTQPIPMHAPKPRSAKYYWPLSSSAASSVEERGRSTLAAAAAANDTASRASSRSREGNHDSPKLPPQSDANLKPLTGSARSSPRPRVADPPFENLVLPTFTDTFERPPRSFPHRKGKLTRAVTAFSAYLFSQPPSPTLDGPRREERPKFDPAARLPKALDVMNLPSRLDKVKRVTVIGIHGWFPNPKLSAVLGEPTGTSVKFATMMHDAVQSYLESHDSTSFNIQAIALEGDGQVDVRVDKLYKQLQARSEWIDSLKKSDAIFIATHSQGSVVSTLLLAQMLEDDLVAGHKTHLLALCAIAHGPFVYLSQSYALSPYFNYLESAAARELFDFQDPESPLAVKFLSKLQFVLAKGVKMTAIGSLNDQVVPLYSALFCGIEHPSIVRAIYIDSAAFRQSDFLANLLVFAARLRNAGLTDHDLTYHVSEVLAGALTGVGHSKIYEEEEVFNLAVRYHFETTTLSEAPTWLSSSVPTEPIRVSFRPRERRNPYILTWTLRGIVEDPQVRELFGNELAALREAFESWKPTSKLLKETKLKLEGIRMLPRVVAKDGKL